MAEVKVKVKSTTEGTENVTKFGDDLKNMVVGVAGGVLAFGAVTTAAKTLYDQLGKGAALVDARHDFDDLASSIGATGDAMRNDLGAATKGLMSDAESMAGATKLMSLNLGLTADQISELVGISADLGWQMEDLGQALNTGSARSLNALGLGIDDVQTRMARLEDQGYATNDAFRMALVEAAKDKIAIVGSAADETAGQMLILQNAIKDAGDQFAVSFSTTMAQSIGDMAGNSAALGDGLFYAADAAGALVGALAKIPLGLLTGLGMQKQIGDLRRELTELGADPGTTKNMALMTDEEQLAEIARLKALLEDVTAQQGQMAAATARTNAAMAGTATAALTAGSAYQIFRAAETAAAGAGFTLEQSIRRTALAMQIATAATSAQIRQLGYYQTLGERAANRNRAFFEATGKTVYEAGTNDVDEYYAAISSGAGAALPAVDELAEATRRMTDAFNTEISLDVELSEDAQKIRDEGLIGDDGMVIVENLNAALYEQAEAAGASAAQLALLGVATGQFTQEQAQAALKAAIMQEQLRKIAAGVVSGDLSINDAMAATSALQTNLDTTQSMDQLQALITEINTSEAAVDVGFDALTSDTDNYINYLRNLKVPVDVEFRPTGGPNPGGNGNNNDNGGGRNEEITPGYIPGYGNVTTTGGSVSGNGKTSDGKPGYSVVFNFNGPVTGAEDVKRAGEQAAKRLMYEVLLAGGTV